jgi:hypothetical protein
MRRARPLRAWRLQLNDFGIEGGQLRWTDALASKGTPATRSAPASPI